MSLSPEIWALIVVLISFIVFLILNFTGFFPVFRWISEYLDLRKKRGQIETLEYLEKIRKENLASINSYLSFRVTSLSHNLKIPVPSAEIQIMVHNYSMFDIKLKKIIYQPSIMGIRSILDERACHKEIIVAHQSSEYFDTSFTVPDSIAKYLEDCKRKANVGEHGKLTWNFKCTIFFSVDSIETTKNRSIQYTKEWYEIELPSKRLI